jgi:hypothetical protein
MITVKIKGSFKNSERFFKEAVETYPRKVEQILHRYGQMGVNALRQFTPKDSGETAAYWDYKVTRTGIVWTNSKHTDTDAPLALMLQYGHGTRGGGYVQGIDYINPALKPIFDQISRECWKEVQNL